MSALLEIRKKRKAFERIEFVSALRLAMVGSKNDVQGAMERWAREAEIRLTFEE
jgi:hypothetical protein